jgi:multiple sugar transport system substrate-binding protein
MGTTLIIYRKDLFQKKQLKEPKTWAEFLRMIKKLEEDRDKDGENDFFGIDLPGGENHFMNCVFSALVSSNRGRFFDKNFHPTLNEKPVLEALEFFKNLSKVALPGWTKRSYMETLKSLATDKAACVYFGSPRLINYIEELAPPEMRSPDVFAVLPDPFGPSGDIGYSQLDCENWVIFQNSKHKKQAKEFLRFFYERDNYLKYCLSVPIHLVPVLKSLSEDPEYLQNPIINKWYSWYKHILKNIQNGTCYPITLMVEKDDILIPFILQFAEAGIVRNMMIDVAVEGICPHDASMRAQSKAKSLLKDLNF